MVFFGFLFIFLLSVIIFVSDRYTMKYVLWIILAVTWKNLFIFKLISYSINDSGFFYLIYDILVVPLFFIMTGVVLLIESFYKKTRSFIPEALLVLTFALLGSSYGETVLSEVTPSWLMIQLIVVVYFCYLLLQNLTEKK